MLWMLVLPRSFSCSHGNDSLQKFGISLLRDATGAQNVGVRCSTQSTVCLFSGSVTGRVT